MEEEKVSPIEVKKYFLLANAGKRLFASLKNKQKLEEKYQRIRDEIFDLDGERLDLRITDKVRLTRYDSFDWYKCYRALSDVGVWPKMCSLDARLTTGNVLETAKMIKEDRKGKVVLHYDDAREMKKRTNAFKKFLGKSESIKKNLGFIYDRFPIILFPGGEIRGEYNSWAGENNSPLCRIFGNDLDDGNARAVSYALEGINEAPCFVGFRKNLSQ